MMGIRAIILRKLAEGPIFGRNWEELAPQFGLDDDPTRQYLRTDAPVVLNGLISQGLVKYEPGVPDDPMYDPRSGPCKEKTQAYSLTESGEEAFRQELAMSQTMPTP